MLTFKRLGHFFSKCNFIFQSCTPQVQYLYPPYPKDRGMLLVASLMSPVASLVTTDRCSNVSMCLRISTKCFLFPGIVPLLYSVGNKTYYYYYGFTSKPPAARNGVNAITQKPRDGLFSNLVYTLVVIVS